MTDRLSRDFYRADGLTLAEALLGKTLVRRCGEGFVSAVITETEAYMGVTDRASHAFGGRRTARTETMYREGGYAYVYLIYGIYSCMNVTAAEEGSAEAVLLRAAVPLEGRGLMLENLRRTSRRRSLPEEPDEKNDAAWAKLLDGPGRLCNALGITRADNAADLVSSEDLFLRDDGFLPRTVLRRPRIGIDYAGEAKEYPWRFTAGEILGMR